MKVPGTRKGLQMTEQPSRAAVREEATQRFAVDLRELRQRSGLTYRELSKRIHVPTSAIARSLSAHELPAWRFVSEFVNACLAELQANGDSYNPGLGTIDDWEQYWISTVKEAWIVPVTIYLSEESIHEQVEAAVDELLDIADLDITDRDDPVTGSWYRQVRAALRTPAAQEAALVAAHAADARLILAQDAAITATMLQNLGTVITALQPTKDAVLRVGALLIVKVDWVVNVFQLTAAQQAKLDHHPQLSRSPHEIISALDLTATTQTEGTVPRLG
jgi:transcriptional regulator with XRE-family HTH domain